MILQNVFWVLILIGIMILVHELGHYVAAVYFNVRVSAFSFGFGPRLFGFKRGETDFKVSAIPFGGYVKMMGENVSDEQTDDPRAFLNRPRWQRLIIALAGPSMNVVLAVALLTGLYMVRFPKSPDVTASATVGHVFPDSAAAKADIREGDRITRIDGIENPTWEDVFMKEVVSANVPLAVELERDGQRLETTVTPILDESSGVGFAGWADEGEVLVAAVPAGMPAEKAGLRRGDLLKSVDAVPIRSRYSLQESIRSSGGKPVDVEYVRDGRTAHVVIQPVYSEMDGPGRWMIGVEHERRMVMTSLSFPAALNESVRQNLKSTTLIFQFLRGIVGRRMSARSLEGPIRIAQLSGDAARQGAFSYVGLMALVSLNLAIFNLLPIPILDGGVILLLLVEMVIRRDISLSVKEAVFKLGFVFLMMVVVFVLYNDISKILPAG